MKINIILIVYLMGALSAAFSVEAKEIAVDNSVSAGEQYTIGIDDIIEINVIQPEKFMSTVTVSPDGYISFSYIGSVKVKGLTLTEIQNEVEKRLADGYMNYPIVSIALKESRSRKFYVYGEVMKPGAYPIGDSITAIQAISMAGGFTKFGSSNRVKALRLNKLTNKYKTIKIDIKSIMNGSSNQDVLIEPGDVIVVSEGIF